MEEGLLDRHDFEWSFRCTEHFRLLETIRTTNYHVDGCILSRFDNRSYSDMFHNRFYPQRNIHSV